MIYNTLNIYYLAFAKTLSSFNICLGGGDVINGDSGDGWS
jgi:hypothetical protein